MLLESEFCSNEVNPIVSSLYICTCIIFTSLCTVQFNRVWWLQASQDLTVDFAVVSKLGVDCFSLTYQESIAKNKRGDKEE